MLPNWRTPISSLSTFSLKVSDEGMQHYVFSKDKLSIHMSCHVNGTEGQESKIVFKCPECPTNFENWRNCAMHLWKSHQVTMCNHLLALFRLDSQILCSHTYPERLKYISCMFLQKVKAWLNFKIKWHFVANIWTSYLHKSVPKLSRFLMFAIIGHLILQCNEVNSKLLFFTDRPWPVDVPWV